MTVASYLPTVGQTVFTEKKVLPWTKKQHVLHCLTFKVHLLNNFICLLFNIIKV